MLHGLLWLMSRLILLVLLLQLLSLILLVSLLMRGLLSLVPRMRLLLLRLMWRLPLLLFRQVIFTVALAASAAIAASTFPAPPDLAAASGFGASGQGTAVVGSVQAPVELFHTDEATLQVT